MIKRVADRPDAAPPDLNEVLSELAIKIERVKQLYEQYFMGLEKIEPMVARKEIARAMLLLQQQYIRNTGLRFRFQTMLQKWNIYTTYWNRILREIENGTYVRHLAKARRTAEREGRELPKELLPPTQRAGEGPLQRIHDVDSDPGSPMPRAQAIPEEKTDPGIERLPVPRPAAPRAATPPPLPSSVAPPPSSAAPPPSSAAPPPSSAAPPPSSGLRTGPPPLPPLSPRAAPPLFKPPPPVKPAAAPLPSVPGMSENDLRALHRKFTDARKASGEGGQVSYEALVNSLAKQVPRVLEQPGVRGVKFDVAVQNGKAVLKATPTR
jgi:hypothetical protein